MIRRIMSVATLFLFLFNIVLTDLALSQPDADLNAYTLAVPSKYDDILGMERQDMERITISFQMHMKEATGLDITRWEDELRKQSAFESKDMQFFFHEIKPLSSGMRVVMCRFEGRSPEETRTYYATFSSHLLNNQGWFPIKVYTSKEWKAQEKAPEAGAGLSQSQESIISALKEVLKADGDDYDIKPVIAEDGATIEKGDSVIMFNFRGDRAIPALRLLTEDPDFKHFSLEKLGLTVVPFAVYDDKYFKKMGIQGVAKDPSYTNTLGEVLAASGKTQVRIAESEKFAHVTMFFDGLRDLKLEGMDTKQIASNKVKKHSDMPDMKAREIAAEAVKWISGTEGKAKKDFALINLSNLDMLGHEDNFEAVVKGAFVVDEALGTIREAVRKEGGVLIVTADHGSGEVMVKLDENGIPRRDAQGNVVFHKAHAFDNKVPFMVEGAGNVKLKDGGSLQNVAPTILELMGIEKPAEMTTDSLLDGYSGDIKGPVVVVVRDGWGISKYKNPEAQEYNAPYQASRIAKEQHIKFNDDELRATVPYTELWAHGEYVGHPSYQMGDSENGHLSIGAGRQARSKLSILDDMLKTGEFVNSPVVRKAIDNAKKGHTLHLLGLISEGAVHSHRQHLLSLLELIAKNREGINKLVIHPIFDGRDIETSECPGWRDLEVIFAKINELGLQDIVKIGVMAGRRYPMDRDASNSDKKGEPSKDLWEERVKPWYDAAVRGIGRKLETAMPVVSSNVKAGMNMEAEVRLASEAGLRISTRSDARYTLLVTHEFFAGGELEENRLKYGDRFNLDSVSGATWEQYIGNILAKANKGGEDRTIALVRNDIPKEHLKTLADAKIRFIMVDKDIFSNYDYAKDAYRKTFQKNAYAMMLLARRVDENVGRDSSLYGLLSFYIKTHFGFTEQVAADEYIDAIVKNDVVRLIKGYLRYRPAEPYQVPEYKTIAAALISA